MVSSAFRVFIRSLNVLKFNMWHGMTGFFTAGNAYDEDENDGKEGKEEGRKGAGEEEVVCGYGMAEKRQLRLQWIWGLKPVLYKRARRALCAVQKETSA